MSLGHRFGHAVLRQVVMAGERRFARDLGQLEKVQRQRLAHLVSAAAASSQASARRLEQVRDWQSFARKLPVTSYGDWADAIENARAGGTALSASPLVRYQPTSGSTSAIKWIPYTRAFLGELDEAIAPWLADLYRQYPNISCGAHYWSLSWLPTDMRDGGSDLNDDMQLLSVGKRLLAAATQAVPDRVALAPTSADAAFATLAYLAANADLSVISVWSPTFALTMLQQLGGWRDELVGCLSTGSWGARAEALGFMKCPRAPTQARLLADWDGSQNPAFFARLWPKLALVSAWDTASATRWAAELNERLPHAGFQGKALWATEGVVTFPWRERHLLAYRSHVYEFEDQDSGKILAPWELRRGQVVVPVISTGSGLFRYRMSDLLHVNGHLGTVPALTFLGREDGVDLVGEKLSSTSAQLLLDRMADCHCISPVSLIALDEASRGAPGYVLLIEGETLGLDLGAMGERVESLLCENFHYRLARSLNQLAPARAVADARMRDFYLEQCRRRGMIEGNIKIEPLRRWNGPVPPLLAERQTRSLAEAL